MAPLVVMLAGWVGFRLAGTLGFAPADSTLGALRFALALMFAFTAAAHFGPRMRATLVRMVPPKLPNPALLVTLTGLAELAGAVGLLVPPLVRPAAWALAALLVAMTPAKVYAARAANGRAPGVGAGVAAAAAGLLDRRLGVDRGDLRRALMV